MKKKSSLSTNQLGFFGELWQQARLSVALMLDREVPIYLKLLPVAAIAYLFFPVDFLPDFVPGLGQLDDLTVLVLGAKMFIDMAPQQVVQRYLRQFNVTTQASGPTVLDADKARSEKQDDSIADNIVEGVIIDDDDLS